jgi:hypothetical protein
MVFLGFRPSAQRKWVKEIFNLNCTDIARVGNGIYSSSEKIQRNRLRTVSVIPQKKGLISRNSEVYGRGSISKLGTEGNSMKKISFTKNPAPADLFRGMVRNRIPPEQTNSSVYTVFRRIIFLSEIANPGYNTRIFMFD